MEIVFLGARTGAGILINLILVHDLLRIYPASGSTVRIRRGKLTLQLKEFKQ